LIFIIRVIIRILSKEIVCMVAIALR